MTTEHLKGVTDLFDDAVFKFKESAPNFSNMINIIAKINEEIRFYDVDFSVLAEDPKIGGGIEQQGDRIESMRKAVPSLQALVTQAEALLQSNKAFYGPYEQQIESAKKIVSALENL